MVIEWLKERKQSYIDEILNKERDIVMYRVQILKAEDKILSMKYAIEELDTVIMAAELALKEDDGC